MALACVLVPATGSINTTTNNINEESNRFARLQHDRTRNCRHDSAERVEGGFGPCVAAVRLVPEAAFSSDSIITLQTNKQTNTHKSAHEHRRTERGCAREEQTCSL